MSSAIVINNGVMHPVENKSIAIPLSAGVAANLDCSQFASDGDMISIHNASTTVLGYKFSSSATPNIDTNATSGAQACGRIAVQGVTRGYIPYGAPNLHLITAGTGYIYVSVTSVNR